MQSALSKLSAVAPMLHEPTEGLTELESAGIFPPGDTDMFEAWSAALRAVTDDAGLAVTLTRPSPDRIGGRRGTHSEHLEPLLTEMSEVFRLEPDAAWRVALGHRRLSILDLSEAGGQPMVYRDRLWPTYNGAAMAEEIEQLVADAPAS